MTLQPFEKWAIDFVAPIQPQGKKTGALYIITATEYLTQWAEAQPAKDCTGTSATTAKFLFEYVLTRFGCLKILMSDHGTHFLNEMISALMAEFQVYHLKITPYRQHANGRAEAFNKVLEDVLTKTPFRLVYGVETVMPMEYIVPSLYIVAFTGITDRVALEERLAQLAELEEERFMAGFHQQVQKQWEKAWHDQHIKLCTFKANDLVLLYENNFDKFPGKFRMHSLGPYIIKEITDSGAV
eukprot:PITA_30377